MDPFFLRDCTSSTDSNHLREEQSQPYLKLGLVLLQPPDRWFSRLVWAESFMMMGWDRSDQPVVSRSLSVNVNMPTSKASSYDVVLQSNGKCCFGWK
ncbi:hypothetical protein AVEN_165883-1 [Araneus ventricosus]|uniref:Uncharacterized protein n=1 Tax=Araneus ventricosus TaxID=182803 RepID=A0A4Y2JAL1_ARAVE|nr:hypothetical protein AVEN_165883-1 [Araneus ventricosus]